LSNQRFARAVEPGNLRLISYAKRREEPRSQGLPTQVKPFLRPRETAVAQAARGHDAATPPDEGDAVAPLRQWKNEFR
jgi:hydroxyacylglutathione hydrolase